MKNTIYKRIIALIIVAVGFGTNLIGCSTVGDIDSNEINVNESALDEMNALIPKAPVFSDNPTDNKYISYMRLAEDEQDYLWDTDYEANNGTKSIKVCDSKNNSEIFGFEKPTLEDLEKAINANSNIGDKYKKVFLDVITEYLRLYPETDFSVLYYNIVTLKVTECTPDVIQTKAGSSTAGACYTISENQIYVNKNIDINSKYGDDWVVLCHEFLHAAKSTFVYKYDSGYKYEMVFFDNPSFGVYTEEALDTYYVYQIQGYNHKSIHYTIASNYYRVILDCLGETYDGADFINHSVNYLAFMMDNYMGEDQGAYKAIAMIESISAKYYYPQNSVDYSSYEYLNEYVTRMYCKKYLKEGMKSYEAEAVFNNLMSELQFNFSNLAKPYDGIKEEYFKPTFEKCCEEKGIDL